MAGTAPSEKSQRKWLWHAICIGVIILASLLLFYKHFLTRGMLMHVDMTFPTSIERNMMLYSHTWWQYGSVQNIWNLQRIFWTYPLLVAVKWFHISTDRYLLIMFIGTFALAGVSMYALAFDTIKRFRYWQSPNRYAIYVGATFAGLIFMYNPFSVSHLWPYFGYPGYAVLPLVFLLLIKAVDQPRMWKIVLLALLISVAGTGPINVVWYWFMIFAFLVFYLLSRRFNRESLLTGAKIFFPLAGLFVLLNATWLFPYAGSQYINKPFNPVYINQFSRSMLDMLSKSGTLVNNVRFTAGWGLPVNPSPHGTTWVVLSFALPVFALAALIVLRRKLVREKTILFWAIMFVVSVLLATGTSSILARPYSWFVLKAPAISSLGWVFRAADRWLLYAAVFYALVLGLLVAYLLRSRHALRNLLALVIVVLVLVSFVPIASGYASNVYNPTVIPDSYAQVNRSLADKPGARPLWLPFSRDGFRYTWAPEKRIGAFAVYSSNDSLNNLQDIFNQDNYYYWLESLYSKSFLSPAEVLNREIMFDNDLASRLFLPLGARYMVLDDSVPASTITDNLQQDRSMQSIYKMDNLQVFDLNPAGAVLSTADRTVLMNSFYDELALARRLPLSDYQKTVFSEHRAGDEKQPGELDINDYLQPYDINSGFEVTGADGRPSGWTFESRSANSLQSPAAPAPGHPKALPDATIFMDTSTRTGGRQSLRITNPSTGDLTICAVTGNEVPVNAGEIYNIETSVKYRNAEWTHVTVEGLQDSTGSWVRLVNCPVIQTGTSSWKRTNCSFYMPPGISRIRPVLQAGWSKNGEEAAVSWFDDIKLSKLGNDFYSALMSAPPTPRITYRQVNAEKYEVSVRGASAPFILAFAQAYDPLWIAQTDDGKTIDPVRLYSTINGFEVDRRGDFKITLKYLPQKWFLQGFIVSLSVLVLCLLYLCFVFLFRRRRNRLEQDHEATETGS